MTILLTLLTLIATYLLSIFFGYRNFIRNCRNTHEVGTRLQFGLQILRVSQLWILCWVLAFIVFSFAASFLAHYFWQNLIHEGSFMYDIGSLPFFFLMGLPFLGLMDIPFAIFTFVVSLLAYPLARKKVTENSSAPLAESSFVLTKNKQKNIAFTLVTIFALTVAGILFFFYSYGGF